MNSNLEKFQINPNIWLLLDERVGNREQCLAVGEALGYQFESKEIRYNFLAQLPNRILGPSFVTLDSPQSELCEAPYPDLIITAGRRAAPIAQKIKTLSNGASKIVQIMWPSGTNTNLFDLICVPNHDRIKKSSKVLNIKTTPHRLKPSMDASLKKIWVPRLSSFPSPRIALIIGGSTKNKYFTLSMANNLAKLASEMANSLGGSLLIITSPRTGKIGKEILSRITAPNTSFLWGNSGENPYKAYLAVSEAIIVTGDSMSMCSEACYSNKPVYIFAPNALITKKHRRLHQLLYSMGIAKPIIEYMVSREGSPLDWEHQPLNSAYDIANTLKLLFEK